MSTVSIEDVMNEIKSVQKDIKTIHKLMRKVAKVQDDPDGSKAEERKKNMGINKLVSVSKELTDFMGLAEGTEVSRTQANKFISTYVKEQGLKDPRDGRKIIQDDKLKNLLKVPKGEELSHISVSKYLTPHFVKA